MDSEAKKMAKIVREAKKHEHKADKATLEELAVLIEKGKWKEAAKFFDYMDTFVREISTLGEVQHFLHIKAAGFKMVVTGTMRIKGSKRNYVEGLGPGVVAKMEWELPGDMPEHRAAAALMFAEKDFIKDVVEVELSEPRRVEV